MKRECLSSASQFTGANNTGPCFSFEGSWANGDFPMDMLGWLEGAGVICSEQTSWIHPQRTYLCFLMLLKQPSGSFL